MDRPTRAELDEIVLGRAIQHGFRLGWTETSTGEPIFKWRRRGVDVGLQFENRRRALDWMADWLDHTPPGASPERFRRSSDDHHTW